MIGIIYKYTSPNGKVYIGQTLDEDRRRKDFLNLSKKYAGRKIENARKKYLPENFQYEILERKEYNNEIEANKDLDILEKYYIELHNSVTNGYNTSYGGVGFFRLAMGEKDVKEHMINALKEYYKTYDVYNKGKKIEELFPQEKVDRIKKRLQECALGRKSGMKGKKHTQEAKEKIREKAKLRTKEKNPFYGKHCTQLQKDALTKANGIEVVQIDKETNEILNVFLSAQKAALFLGKKKNCNGTILDACREIPRKGHRKVQTLYGYKWKFKKDIEGSTTIGTDGKLYYCPSTSTLQANGNGSGEHLEKDDDIV